MTVKVSIKSVSDKRILLTGVFGPFAKDDEYGSRKINPMELYHNQVTRVQGPFSLRMFHRTMGLMMIEANIDAPCTLLDFPTLDRFIDEIRTRHFDVIGISAIVPNIGKVQKMCDEIRRYQPEATIVVGGHIANLENLENRIDADHICRGDGIRWFRKYLGQDLDAPIMHPAVISGFKTRILGIPVSDRNTAAVLIPSVGCPVGCNFCSTSALFGGKGNSVSFYETGDEIFAILCNLEKKLGTDSFFVLDENFLLYRQRVLRLMELMEEHGKSWAFYIFSSARVLQSYTMDQLTRIGIAWVWMGLEGKGSQYSKLNGVDTIAMVKKFQENGIRVLGSTIIGLEEHTPENIHQAIEFAVQHNTDFHQFMLYTPMPGTPLYHKHRQDQTLLPESECAIADSHGQDRFNYLHSHIRDGQETQFLLDAFQEDFRVNGPSLIRIIRTTLNAWQKHKNHPDKRIVKRIKSGMSGFSSVYSASVWAIRKYYNNDPHLHAKANDLLEDLYQTFGWKTRFLAPIIGQFLSWTIRREEQRLNRGWTYEPPVVYEKNALAIKLDRKLISLPDFRIKKIKMPVYDLSRVVANYRNKMADAKAQLQDIRNTASEEFSRICQDISQRTDQARLQLNQMSRNVREKRNQTGEQVLQMIDKFMEQCEFDRQEILRMYENMIRNCEEISTDMTQLRSTMIRKYKAAGEQIDQISQQISEKQQQVRAQIDHALEQTKLQLNQLDSLLKEARG